MEGQQEQPKTQAEIDEIQKMNVMSNEYENQLKKDIEDNSPFISELMDTNVVMHEYTGTKFEASFSQLIKSKEEGGRGYQHIRRLRRDGNCFYRAYLFQLFEHYALDMGEYKTQYDNLIKIVEESKEDLSKNAGYEEIVIEDFYDVFLENLKKLEKMPEDFKAQEAEGLKLYDEFVHKQLMNMLCNHEEANYIIMYARFMAAAYLKKNSILFEDFLGCDIATFCLREVEQVSVECDHPQIIAITNYLQQGVEINAVSQQGAQIDVTNIPEDNFKDNSFQVKVLFVPGHYDALYE